MSHDAKATSHTSKSPGGTHSSSSGGASLGVPIALVVGIGVFGTLLNIFVQPAEEALVPEKDIVQFTDQKSSITMTLKGNGKRSPIVTEYYGHFRLEVTCDVPFVIILADGSAYLSSEPETWVPNGPVAGNPDVWLYDQTQFSLPVTGKDAKITVRLVPNDE